MTNNTISFSRIDQIIERVHQFKIDPAFQNEIDERKNRKVIDIMSNDELLKFYATIAAFSQAANSKNVRDNLLSSGDFENMFHGFSVDKVSVINLDSKVA